MKSNIRPFQECALVGGDAVQWEQGELWRMLAHDMRTPLNGLQGFLDLLSFTPLNADQKEYLSTALECTETLQVILTGVMESADTESGRLLVFTQPTDVRELITSTIGQYKLLAKKQGIELKCTISPTVPRLLSLDKSKLFQILANLVGNAVKFTPKGHVTVGARMDHDHVLFDVTDTGIGIPEDEISQVSKAYYQCAGNDGVSAKGSGLGLAIVEKLVATLNGKLVIESSVCDGTAVSVRLPT